MEREERKERNGRIKGANEERRSEAKGGKG